VRIRFENIRYMDVPDKDVQISLSPLKLEIIFKVNPANIRPQTLATMPHTQSAFL